MGDLMHCPSLPIKSLSSFFATVHQISYSSILENVTHIFPHSLLPSLLNPPELTYASPKKTM
jgi:hypothetical protein